jgi:60 kDa SS-A/Ro ribonucleoprotein
MPGAGQAPNSAGGFAWEVDDWKRLRRFLILGTEAGSYYASEWALTRENAQALERCILADGRRCGRGDRARERGGAGAEERPGAVRSGDGGRSRR